MTCDRLSELAGRRRLQIVVDDIDERREPRAATRNTVTACSAGQNARDRDVNPRFPVSFDLTRDQPDNRILDENGVLIYALGSFVRDTRGRAIIELFSDLKRHNM